MDGKRGDGNAILVCGFCKSSPKELAFANGERQLTCMKCGQRDDPNHAHAIARDHARTTARKRTSFRWHFAPPA